MSLFRSDLKPQVLMAFSRFNGLFRWDFKIPGCNGLFPQILKSRGLMGLFPTDFTEFALWYGSGKFDLNRIKTRHA